MLHPLQAQKMITFVCFVKAKEDLSLMSLKPIVFVGDDRIWRLGLLLIKQGWLALFLCLSYFLD